jgi:hypothetical protein
MVRLIGLLIFLSVLYYALIVNKEVKEEPLGFAPGIITVEELPDEGNE